MASGARSRTEPQPKLAPAIRTRPGVIDGAAGRRFSNRCTPSSAGSVRCAYRPGMIASVETSSPTITTSVMIMTSRAGDEVRRMADLAGHRGGGTGDGVGQVDPGVPMAHPAREVPVDVGNDDVTGVDDPGVPAVAGGTAGWEDGDARLGEDLQQSLARGLRGDPLR